MVKNFIKQKIDDQTNYSGIVRNVIIIAAIFVFSVPVLLFTMFGNLMSTMGGMDDTSSNDPNAIVKNLGGNEVISLDTYKDVTSRIEQLRTKTNESVDVPGENYGNYRLNASDSNASTDSNSNNTTNPSQPKSDLINQGASQSQFPQADPNIWVTGAKANVNEGLLRRLAAVGQHYGKTVNIYSGQRPFEEQKKLYECYKARLPGCNNAADPMYDTHVLGLAVDVSGWLQTDVPSSALAPFGLAKEVAGENWHIMAKGILNIPREKRIYYQYDGYGVPQELINAMFQGSKATNIPQVGSNTPITSADANGVYSEAFIHLLALNQTDQLNMISSDNKYLDSEEKKGTNMGKTWTLAKKLKHEVTSQHYKDQTVNDRAFKEKWGNAEYMDLARWEIQKCFFLGDENQSFLAKIFGSQTPCGYIEGLTKETIVPKKLQGVVSKETTEKTKDGEKKTVTYSKVLDILNMYKEISLFDDKKDFEPTLKDILDSLYTRNPASPVMVGPTDPGVMSKGEETFNENFVKAQVDPSWKPIMTTIVRRESTFDPTAQNSTSTAYGYAQFLKQTREEYDKKLGLDYDHNPVHQIIEMYYYIKDRYKTPENALLHWDTYQWY